MWERWRKFSRAKMLLIWTSTTGTATAATASRMATEVWVYAPALMMMPAAFLAAASWIKSTISPSWFDWRNSTASLCGLAAKLLDVLERRAAIGLWLAGAEEIEVGAIEDVDGFRHGRSAAATKGASRFIGTSRAKGKRRRERAIPAPPAFRPSPAPQREFTRRARPRRPIVEAKGGSSQQVGLPQRAPLTFSLSVLRPTAPTR